jgi:hypothetical protein
MIRPDWHLFYEAASDYNHRYFTYPNDIVDAFRGVEAYLAPLFGQFVYGIPLAYFDVALLWMPRNQNAERRDNAERVPSWSWMSFRSVISCFTNHDSQHIPQDLGGTEWFLKYGDELFSVRKLASSRHFPRPSLESSMPNYPDLRDPTPLLFGKVERVKASIVDIGWHERMVLDRGEKACGMVAVPEVSAWLDGRFELIKMSSHTGSHYISVNTNFRQGDLAEKVAIEDFEAKKDGECVNVMLIEREGDVAFRKGIGYILQESWQTLDREWVGITLR